MDSNVLKRSRDYQKFNFNADTKSAVTGDAAGVLLYSISSTARASAKDAQKAEVVIKQAKKVGKLDTNAKVTEENSSGEVKTDISMYPNPSDGIVNITINPIKSKTIKITLSNSNGKIVLEKNLVPSEDNITNSVDISTLPKGMYIVRIASDNQEQFRKIIKK